MIDRLTSMTSHNNLRRRTPSDLLPLWYKVKKCWEFLESQATGGEHAGGMVCETESCSCSSLNLIITFFLRKGTHFSGGIEGSESVAEEEQKHLKSVYGGRR